MARSGYYAPWHLAACAALALGEALGLGWLAGGAGYWPLGAYLTATMTLLALGYASRALGLVAVAALGLTLALAGEVPRQRALARSTLEPGPFTMELEVGGGVSRHGDWVSFNGTGEGILVRVVFEGDERPQIGERWQCAGWLERQDASQRGRRTLWVRGRGTFARRVARSRQSWLARWLARSRCRLSLASAIGLDHAPLALALNRAILLGERDAMPRWVRVMFAQAGTAHIFAISGLHVGILATLLAYLLGGVFFPRRWLIAVLAPILWLYVAMIGAPASAVRAAAMASVYYLAPVFLRRADSLVAWSVTFLAFHLWRPSMLFEVGSLLSFSVVLGILLYLRWAGDFRWRPLSGPVAISGAAWLSGGAISAAVFGGVSLGGILANLLLIPLASVGVVFGALGATVGLFLPLVAAHLNNAAALITEAMIAISWLTVRLPGQVISAADWPWWYFLAWYLVPILTLYLIRSIVRRHRHVL